MPAEQIRCGNCGVNVDILDRQSWKLHASTPEHVAAQKRRESVFVLPRSLDQKLLPRCYRCSRPAMGLCDNCLKPGCRYHLKSAQGGNWCIPHTPGFM